MVTAGVVVFIIGAALWLLGRRDPGWRVSYDEVLSARARQGKTRGRLSRDVRNFITPAVRERALWLTIVGTVAVMVGYRFQWWEFLAALLLISVTVPFLGLLWLLFRFFGSYPHHSKDHKHALKLTDGTAIPFTIRVDWRLPHGLTKYDDATVLRDVEARVAEWFVSLTLDPPKTEDDALALIKNANTKLAAFLVPAVLPHDAHLSITVTDVTPPSKAEEKKYPGIIIGVSE